MRPSKLKDFWQVTKAILLSLIGIEVELSWKCSKCGAWDWGTIWEFGTRFSCEKHRKI